MKALKSERARIFLNSDNPECKAAHGKLLGQAIAEADFAGRSEVRLYCPHCDQHFEFTVSPPIPLK